MAERFDMVVIGSGPAGEKAAAQAAYFGHRVAVGEQAPRPGGAAVSSAGIPTKTLRETALYLTGFRRRDVYGLQLHLDPEATLARLRSRPAEVVETMTVAVERNLERHGIELVRGHGRIGPDRTVVVERAGQPPLTLAADVIMLATGSRPFHPPAVPFDDPDVHDSQTLLGIDHPFGSAVVLGRGIVGCEYASIMTALGVEVTLVGGGRLVEFVDAELSGLLAAGFERLGMRLLLGRGRPTVSRDAGGLRVELPDGTVVRGDKVLSAAGRVGATEDLGLEAAGVRVDQRGRVLVDAAYWMGVPGVYAAGDVIGPPTLASAAMEQGRVAACHAFAIPFKETVAPLAPYGVYSIPEVAMVGLTEEAAAATGVDYEVGRGWFADNARATIAGARDGLVKLVFRADDRRLLGVHVLGDTAAELVHVGQMVLHQGGGMDHFIHTTFNVPTQSEAYKYAAYDGLQRLAARA